MPIATLLLFAGNMTIINLHPLDWSAVQIPDFNPKPQGLVITTSLRLKIFQIYERTL